MRDNGAIATLGAVGVVALAGLLRRGSVNQGVFVPYTLKNTTRPPEKGEWTLIIHRSKGNVREWFLQEPQGTGGGSEFYGDAKQTIRGAVKKAMAYWEALKRLRGKSITAKLRVMVIDDVTSDTWKDFYINTKTLQQIKR